MLAKMKITHVSMEGTSVHIGVRRGPLIVWAHEPPFWTNDTTAVYAESSNGRTYCHRICRLRSGRLSPSKVYSQMRRTGRKHRAIDYD